MNDQSGMKSFLRRALVWADHPAVWMGAACCVWLFIFRDYLTGRVPIFSDATSYLDHTRYFVESLKQGVFPLWDYFWNNGSPNDFFLRRIGCYNPIYVLMAALDAVGFSYHSAYLLIHSLYFFFGAFGLFLLVQTIYRDTRVSFTAFLLFLFSTTGARIFDSYLCLIIVPTIWFFYFSHEFLSAPRRRSLAGLCLSAMIAMNTYVPVFFVTIVFAVGGAWLVFFWKEAVAVCQRVLVFFRKAPFAAGCLIGILLLSLIPPVTFLLESGRGSFVMPDRHGSTSAAGNILSVDPQFLSWGVLEDVFFSALFKDLRGFQLWLIYIPLVWFILFALGAFCRMNRRILFYASIVFVFCLLGPPFGAAFHQFLLDHVFYFKYIRNLHFFFWFLVLPLLILMGAEFLSGLLQMDLQPSRSRVRAVIVVVAVHTGAFLLVLWQGAGIWSSFWAIAASLVIMTGYLLKPSLYRGGLLWAALLVMVAPQAVQVLSYGVRNMPHDGRYEYDTLNRDFVYTVPSPSSYPKEVGCDTVYFSTAQFYEFCQGVSVRAFYNALGEKLVAYDRVEPFDRSAQDFARLDEALLKGDDTVFVAGWKSATGTVSSRGPLRFSADSPELRVVRFDANRLVLRTNFSEKKFLVYHDNMADGWRASVDRKNVPLLVADGSFKGVSVPAGEQIVEFRYGNPIWYGFNVLLLIFFNLLFYGTAWVFLRKRERRR